ncbi:hypothetical protein COCCADRAFT_111890, partial [Bipolaris zeicola 26-R-13]
PRNRLCMCFQSLSIFRIRAETVGPSHIFVYIYIHASVIDSRESVLASALRRADKGSS